MSGAPRVRSVNVADLETREVLGHAGNKAGSVSPRKSGSKPLCNPKCLSKDVKSLEGVKSPERKMRVKQLSPVTANASSVLSRHEKLLNSNLSLNASCSSDASIESFHSRASIGRLMRSSSMGRRRKPSFSKPKSTASDGSLDSPSLPGSSGKKNVLGSCRQQILVMLLSMMRNELSQFTTTSRKLFELLVFSGALAELTWPAIFSKRDTFREVLLTLIAVSKFSEKKMAVPGNPASSLLSEPKLRAVIENACQITTVKIISLFVSLISSCRNVSSLGNRRVRLIRQVYLEFMNNEPVVSRFRYPCHVPAKSPKADVIRQNLVRRGF